MALFLEHFEQTEEGRKLNELLPKEVLEDCRVVYAKDKDSDGYLFKSPWNPDESYGEDDIIIPVQSSFDCMSPVAQGEKFANIIGSTGDPIDNGKYSSWIKMFEAKYTEWNKSHGTNYNAYQCCTDGSFYNGQTGIADTKCTCDSGIPSNHKMVGGHIILTDTPQKVSRGKEVYILPICGNHNKSRIKTNRNLDGFTGGSTLGTDYYMITGIPSLAMKMKNYQPNKSIIQYLEIHGRETVRKL